MLAVPLPYAALSAAIFTFKQKRSAAALTHSQDLGSASLGLEQLAEAAVEMVDLRRIEPMGSTRLFFKCSGESQKT